MPPQPSQNQPDQTPPPNQGGDGIVPIHTYKSDVAEFMKTEGKTLADIAIAENARHSKYLEEEAAKPERTKKLLRIGGAVLVLVVVSILIIYLASSKKPTSPVSANSAPSMFVSGINEKGVSVEKLNQASATRAIAAALKESAPFLALDVTVKDAKGMDTAVNSSSFFEKLGIYPPADLLRALSGQFAIGSIGGKVRFLVLKTNYYAGAFAGMLEWEKSSIEKDLRGLLDLPALNSSGIITAGSGATTTLISINQSVFADTVISNRDTRILRDGSGATILLYLFPDNNTIVITGSENAAKIVTEKLLKAK
jgi:hypothetical protein